MGSRGQRESPGEGSGSWGASSVVYFVLVLSEPGLSETPFSQKDEDGVEAWI